MVSQPFNQIMQQRLTRRRFLKGAGAVFLGAGLQGCAVFSGQQKQDGTVPLTFKEIAKSTAATHAVPEGYRADILIRWGDPLVHDLSPFDPYHQSADEQSRRFGYNNDYIAFLPLPLGSGASNRGILCVNHEYSMPRLMFSGMSGEDEIEGTSYEQVRIEQESQGHTLVEVERVDGRWHYVQASAHNRRVTVTTHSELTGPAAGHSRLRTSQEVTGTVVKGTLANCAGGKTPWGTVLTAEENFNTYFHGDGKGSNEETNHKRYGVGNRLFYGWHRFEKRFDTNAEPNEPNRFGWVVEIDPFEPDLPPFKRTALGRFKHEGANTVIAKDGRLVIYSGDDERFEYIYRFVTCDKVDRKQRRANRHLLDHGILSVARFAVDGTLQWLPLVFGQGPLTPDNGFHSQADVLIETRRAADLLGATPMDRPEGIDINPVNGRVYAAMTNNTRRDDDDTDAPNPRAPNPYGHVIEMIPPEKGMHTAETFRWDVFLLGGNPHDPTHQALYGGKVSQHGWLTNPDNLTFDPAGRIWIATDGQPQYVGWNDGLYAAQVAGKERAVTRKFFSAPAGAEVCGPAFTPDGTTLFLAVQHPGDSKGATFDNPPTRWPDFSENAPPRPAVIAITKEDGGTIGS